MTAAATTWGAGDYAQMARLLEPAAAAVVDAAAVTPGERVCDIATGTGNAALLAAARGGRTTGVDLEPALLRIAEQRAHDAQLDIAWVRGDAQALPLPDNSADVALSVFGTMYGADHRVTASEIRRICADGARVVLASWVPGSFMPSMGKTLSVFLPPPPPATGPPSAWGDPESLGMLLADAGLILTGTTRRSVSGTFTDPSSAADMLIYTAGHVVVERDRLVAEGRWGDLHAQLTAFVADNADTTTGRVRLTLEYLLADAERA